jgi:hypothetical protein
VNVDPSRVVNKLQQELSAAIQRAVLAEAAVEQLLAEQDEEGQPEEAAPLPQ